MLVVTFVVLGLYLYSLIREINSHLYVTRPECVALILCVLAVSELCGVRSVAVFVGFIYVVLAFIYFCINVHKQIRR